ncbi:hypothetical protein L6164_020993 [Bauhinia variegata]|uniref:Uncharacterized protein n=1 Tax=Bauhinia variegata TaxID=167791 RepID=A0ACB9MX33_BAUVA|nr:hypothetical protein L6164_020993 [Bauhinia variegata]
MTSASVLHLPNFQQQFDVETYASGVALNSELLSKDAIILKLRSKLVKAQQLMKTYADKSRIPAPFKLGDLVWVKLRSYKQVSTAGHHVQKLAKRFYGPYRITRCIGDIAYELALLPGCQINAVFHASLLKPYTGSADIQPLPLPMHAHLSHPILQPLAVLDHNSTTNQILVQWQGLYLEDSTWEDFMLFKQTYPNFHLEDKVLLDRGGDDRYEDGPEVDDQDPNEKAIHKVP